MKYFFAIVFMLVSTFSFAQIETGDYTGWERMCYKGEDGKTHCYDWPHKWYRKNSLHVRGDSVFLYQCPVEKTKNGWSYSASDGGFYYLLGNQYQGDTTWYISYSASNCDYCGQPVKIDSATGFMYPVYDTFTFPVIMTKSGCIINGVNYTKQKKIDTKFSKARFYREERPAYRINPTGQYQLISAAVNDFLQLDSIKYPADTCWLVADRFDEYDSLFEKLDTAQLKLAANRMVIGFLTAAELKRKLKHIKTAFCYIETGKITDYPDASVIDIFCKIMQPKKKDQPAGTEFYAKIEYQKSGSQYKLVKIPLANVDLYD